MANSQFADDERLLLDDAYDAFRNHFLSREGFLAEYARISSHLLKERFLRLASIYRNLVKNGSFRPPSDALTSTNYYDVTYRFIALISIIEAVFAKDEWLDFYEWLKSDQSETIFPIEDRDTLNTLYKQYKLEYGAIKNFVKFFKELKQEEQEFLKAKLIRLDVDKTRRRVSEIDSEINELADLLYDIRSKFMHNARLIIEFSDVPSITTRKTRFSKSTKAFTSTLTLNQFMRVFEIGFLRCFGISPERRILLF